jgi:formylglycine-generating enzyme required for sulfatase activity
MNMYPQPDLPEQKSPMHASSVCGGLFIAIILVSASSLSPAAANNDMVSVPAGPFTMGSNEDEADERPAHTVELAAFTIDRLPVTNAQFARFLDAVGPRGPYGKRYYDDDDNDARIHRRNEKWLPDPGFEDHPVVEASWPGAHAYCGWRGARLPTEAEWEKAARGTDKRRYPWGNQAPDDSRARFGAGWNETSPVHAHPAGASPYGMLDAAGNAWEWVSSEYRPYPWRADDGRENLDADVIRGTRGGGHNSPENHLTATHRGRHVSRNPNAGHHNIGFRCVK